MKPRALRALFLADLGPIPAHVVASWCGAGHEIAEIWTADSLTRGQWKRERRRGWFAPQWSLAAAIRRGRIPHRPVPPFKRFTHAAELIAALRVDVVISVHFTRILPASLLARLPMPVVNLHPALLPAYRGGTPLVSMIVDGAQQRYSGVTLHRIVAAVDAGEIFAARPVAFPGNGSLRQWELDLARAAAALAVTTIPRIVAGEMSGVAQTEELASYRSSAPEELQLSPDRSLAEVTRICVTLGQVRPLAFSVGGRDLAVVGVSRLLGPPSGEPPLVGWRHIETDLADARVVLRRRPWWEGRRQRLATLLLHMRSR